MYFKKSILGSLITLVIAATTSNTAVANEVTGNFSKLNLVGSEVSNKTKATSYIVQLKGIQLSLKRNILVNFYQLTS